MINKVAGVYGLIAVLTGAGGSAAQVTLYVYSCVALAAFVWGLRAINQEDPKYTLYFAHVFAVDHILNTAWTVFFAVMWWMYTPHDGRRQANSPAQEEMALAGAAQAAKIHNMTAQEREFAAMELWDHEKGTAGTVIALGWLAKIYFALLIYSYAVHLRKGSYRSLATSRPSPQNRTTSLALPDDDSDLDLPIEDFYRLPTSANPSSARRAGTIAPAPSPGDTPAVGLRSRYQLLEAEGRRMRGAGRPWGVCGFPTGKNTQEDELDEVLFDEGEVVDGVASGSGTSRTGSASAGEDEGTPVYGRRSPGARV
ncbi:hypothetical protein EUX98_g2170 [Antrodiella citrinella]|uniref:DUF1753-domain-containing protein n=1 Tax=Antrodiella citrinella TaxID=2447956 RepID=A0A4S4N2L8_9APHY|nr:hypothetical protein EUX98_g2170 [Antrodiella citrinella]